MTTPTPTGPPDDAARARFRRADALLDAALDLPTDERAAFVLAACEQDAELRDDVERLLRAHDRSRDFLATPAAGAPLRATGALDDRAAADHRARLQRALGDAFTIERELGAGGMAVVYLAHDRKHDRRVALKLLHPELRAVVGAERFLAEIRVTAALQHPNLVPLFDSGEADGLLYYVMPYVDGESLRARLRRERQLPVAEAVRLTVAMADALDHAHRQGVVHRDLKPENVLLQDGQPRVADFGIALAVSRAGGERLTQQRVTIGTPQYMSPEQAAGDRDVDARSDVYALGCLLYEMLAGEPPHTGGTVQAVLRRVLTETPRPVGALRPSVPPAVEAALARALATLPADRFATVRDFAGALVAADGDAGAVPPTAAVPLPTATRRRDPVRLALAAAALLALGAAAWQWRERRSAPAPPVRFAVEALRNLPFGSRPVLTPDGRTLVFADSAGGRRGLFVRPLGDERERALPGTEGAVSAFVSPDGRWIGFLTVDDRLRKVPIGGGASTDLAGAFRFSRASWAANGTIVTDAYGQRGLTWLPDGGGPLHPLTSIDAAGGESDHAAPLVVPGADAVVFTVQRQRGGPAPVIGELAIAPLGTGDGPVAHRLLGVRGRYAVAVVDGWLLYAGPATGTLLAVRLDARAGRAAGAPVTVLEDSGGLRTASLGADGTLLYLRDRAGNAPVLVDERGATEPLAGVPAGSYMNPRFSPDGRRLAIQATSPQGSDVWVYDLASRTSTRLTTSGNAVGPTWTPDGERIVFLSTRAGSDAVWWQRADGSAPAEQLTEGNGLFAPSVAPDGRTLVFQRQLDQLWSLWTASVAGDRTPRPLVRERFDDLMPAVSPDGRWLAYVSTSSGRPEVYVRPFPGRGAPVQLSVAGGTEPAWSPDGRRVYYRTDGEVVAATLRLDGGAPSLTVTGRAPLFADRYDRDMPHRNYDVAPDGRRFVMVATQAATDSEAVVVLGWLGELRAKLAGK